MSADVQAVLERAAQILERDGWRQGAMGLIGEPHCVLGACRAACWELNLGLPESAYWAAHAELESRIGRPGAFVVSSWNDTPGRMLTEALALLRGTPECDCEGEVVDGRWVRRYCAACRAREEA